MKYEGSEKAVWRRNMLPIFALFLEKNKLIKLNKNSKKIKSMKNYKIKIYKLEILTKV